MQLSISNSLEDPFAQSISPLWEMAAYEALWNEYASFKKIAEIFQKHPGHRPSDLVPEERIHFFQNVLKDLINNGDAIGRPNILINNTYDYPRKLRDAGEPVEVLYFRGDPSLLNTRSIAIVGTRKPSEEGLLRAERLVKLLVEDKITIISGLAEGIDTKVHRTAIKYGGKTIAVIGTPLNQYYPKNNKELQDLIAREHLLISQVPYWKYSQQTVFGNRLFFPERNKTMSALSEATVIIEAGETSGTLIQARAALQQGRKLFILDSCFNATGLTWPKRFEERGAIRVRDYNDIKSALSL